MIWAYIICEKSMQEDSVASSLSNISFSMNVNSGGIADPFYNSLKPLEYVPS